MNQAQTIELAKWWVSVYEYHREEITEAQSLAYARDCGDIPFSKMVQSWKQWRLESHKPPMPIDIRSIAAGKKPLEQEAQLIADRIIQALLKYRKNHEREAFEALGPAAEHAIKSRGGWSAVWNQFNPEKQQAVSFLARDLKSSVLAFIVNSRLAARHIDNPCLGTRNDINAPLIESNEEIRPTLELVGIEIKEF